MSPFNRAIVLGCFALFLLTSLGHAFGQSGSRNSYRREREPTVSKEQQLLIQQQNALQQQANAAQRRLQYLKALSANPNSKENRAQLAQAYNDAKSEFAAIRNGRVLASGSRLQRPFLLRSNDLNRKARNINWPKPLREQQHEETIGEIEVFVKDMESNADELNELIAQLSLQIEKRIIEKTIDIKEYAKAKRFLSGLANETDL